MNKTLIFFIAGNPSVPGVYDPFINHLTQSLEGDSLVETEILLHIGQRDSPSEKLKKIHLTDVIGDHRNTILESIKVKSPDRIILIGHSLGSTICISLTEELSPLVDQFIYLCPFLGPEKQNEKYLKIFKNPLSRFSLKTGSHLILSNKKISNVFFRNWLGENKMNNHIIAEIKKRNYLSHFFILLSGYFKDFDSLQIKKVIPKLDPEKSFFLFAKEDLWVPLGNINLLPKGSKYEVLDNISHDFCLFEDEYKSVSSVLKTIIKL